MLPQKNSARRQNSQGVRAVPSALQRTWAGPSPSPPPEPADGPSARVFPTGQLLELGVGSGWRTRGFDGPKGWKVKDQQS